MQQHTSTPRDEHFGMRALARPDAHIPEHLWPELIVEGWERIHNHTVSPDGKRVAFYWDRGSVSDLWVMDIGQVGFPQRLTLNRPHVNWWEDEPATWSPDGAWLVYGAYGDDTVSNLYVISGHGSAPRQLTELSEDAAEPTFSPDGRFIAFSTQKGDTSQIALVPFEGGWVNGLTALSDECTTPVWSPDGMHIIYSASPPHGRKQNDVFALAMTQGAANGTPVRLTPDDNVECWSPAFSPSGDRIAMQCNYSGYDELWLMAADGSRQYQLSRLGLDIEEFAWSPDGTRLIAIANKQACDFLFVINAQTGAAHAINCPRGNYSGAQWLAGREAEHDDVLVGFDAPDSPPALYVCEVNTGAMTQLTNTCAAALRHASFVTPQHVEYVSKDGWMIPAFLYQPEGDCDDKRGWPAIVYPHGGPNVHYDLSWDPIRQYFVAKGYAIICPNFRGSTGYGRKFKEGNVYNWGVGDLNDCLFAADYLIQHANVDRQRIGIWGQSYGGYLSLLALTKDMQHRFKCGVCLYGDSHLKTSWATGDHAGRLDLDWQMGHPGVDSERFEASSPLNFVRNLRAPLLVLHGEQDQRVAFSESLQLVAVLKREGKTFEFHSYPDEAHGFAKAENALDALLRIERFLDWWLV